MQSLSIFKSKLKKCLSGQPFFVLKAQIWWFSQKKDLVNCDVFFASFMLSALLKWWDTHGVLMPALSCGSLGVKNMTRTLLWYGIACC